MKVRSLFQSDGRLIWGLAISQLVGWGTMYFAFSLFVRPMQSELGWSSNALNGALTFGLFVADLVALPVGYWVDRHGGRLIMTLGAALGAVALIVWSGATSLWHFYLAWFLIGVAQAASLINPAMTVLAANVRDYRRAVTYVSLLTGLSSTFAWPVTSWLIDGYGWRQALVGLAVLQLAVPMLANLYALRGTQGHLVKAFGETSPDISLPVIIRQRAFWAFAVAFGVYWFVGSGLTIHLIPMLQEQGMQVQTVVSVMALQGPAQVLGRMAILLFGHDVSARQLGRIVFPLWGCALLLLLFLVPAGLPGLIAFALVYGGAFGTLLIVRSTGIVEIFGSRGYGAITGALSTVSIVPRTSAPLGFALLHTALGGYRPVIWLMFGLTMLGSLAFWIASSSRGSLS
jgi:MFS family permease